MPVTSDTLITVHVRLSQQPWAKEAETVLYAGKKREVWLQYTTQWHSNFSEHEQGWKTQKEH